MKVLHLSKYYYPYVGGIEQVARDCVNALAGSAQQRIFCFNTQKKDERGYVDEFPVLRAGTFAKVSSQSLSTSYGRLLKREFREFSPDVVIFHYPNPFAAHYLLKILKKYPACKLVIYWHLDITKQKILKKFFHGQNIRLCKRAETVIGATPNHLNCSAYYKWFRQKCRVLPYGIPAERLTVTERAAKLAEEIRTRNEGNTILFALGRLVPYKGMEYLVNASALLDKNYRIFIAGTGPLEEQLKALAKGDEKITFLGEIDDETRKAYALACDIFCFPSITKNEAFGLALAEAMAFGKPAVTFTIEGSGVNYVSLNGETGIEVENRNVAAYAEAIKTLAGDEALRKRLGEGAKKRVEENFTEVKFRENLQSLMQEITK